jgi:hypothetical protein
MSLNNRRAVGSHVFYESVQRLITRGEERGDRELVQLSAVAVDSRFSHVLHILI